MRYLAITALFAWTASGQVVAKPADRLAAEKLLKPGDNEKVLRCEVETSKAELNFGLRFQAGYVLQVPLVQYSGAGHFWNIALRVTPDGAQPIYLVDRQDLPNFLRPEYSGEATGAFLVGEGQYDVEFAAVDDKERVCRKEWRIDAAIGRGQRETKFGIPARKVEDLTWTGPKTLPAGPPRPRRLTVLLNGSDPYTSFAWSPYRREIVPHTGGPKIETPMDYRSALMGILASLVEKLPGTKIRLVVFDLDQQKETLRQEDFTLRDLAKAAHAANNTDHWAVTVRELQDQLTKWGMLANLVEREAGSEERPDAVLFLGPRMGPLERMPAHLFDGAKGVPLRFFYLQYRLSAEPIPYSVPEDMGPRPADGSIPPLSQPDDRMAPEVSDPIDLAVARLKGRTLKIHSPSEFAKAVEAVRQASAH